MAFEGMHCAACAVTIEAALSRLPGVESVQVSAASHHGRIAWRPGQTQPSAWLREAARIGYPAVPANNFARVQARRDAARKMVWRWAVAGLCMMQIMMYTTPAYVATPEEMDPSMLQLLRWAQWVIALPLMLFSCGPFFRNAWRDLRERRVSMDLPVTLGILITFAISTVGTFDPHSTLGREVYFDSLSMFVFFLLTGRWLELRLSDRTAGALEALMHRMPEQVERRKGARVESVALRQLKRGDEVHILPGQAFVGDGHLVEGRTQVDEALLTGESRPLARGEGEAVIAGSYNLQSPVWMRVERLGGQTRFAQILDLMEGAAVSKPRLALLADRIAKPFLWAVLAAAVLAAAWWWPTDPAHALMVAVAVLVVTCPCALSLATPAAMLAAAGRLAKQGVLVRHLQSLEALSQADVVLLDKTGTLTRDAFVLDHVELRPGLRPDQALALAAALAAHSLHPASRALVAAHKERGQASGATVGGDADAQRVPLTQVQELAGQGLSARMGSGALGVPDVVGELRLGSSAFAASTASAEPRDGAAQDGAPLPASAIDAQEALPEHLQVHLSDGAGWLARFALREDVRGDAREAVDGLKALGLHVAIVSGDSSQAVARVAEALGVSDCRSACTPQDKLAVLREWQQQGRKVVMVGDGLNDGPVMAAADVSFALGHAVPLAQSRSDLIVADARLLTVLDAFRLAERTQKIVRQNLVWAAVYNALCVPLAVFGYLPAWLAGWGMAMSSLLVVLNARRLT